MSKYSWGFTLPESVLKTQATLNGLAASALAMSDAWKAAVPHYDFSGAYAALNAYLDNYESISRQVAQISSLAKSILPLIDTSVFDTLKHASAATKALQDVDWGWVVNAYAEAFGSKDNDDQEFSENISQETLTPEIRAEIAADITEVLSNPEELQCASQSKYLQWKERSPGFAAFFIELLWPFLLVVIQIVASIWMARPVKNAQVYEEPTSTSNVVYNVTVENNITVIGDVPYFYKVEFPDPETGELVTGYIYKANLTEIVPDAAENTETSESIPETTESQTEPTE